MVAERRLPERGPACPRTPYREAERLIRRTLARSGRRKVAGDYERYFKQVVRFHGIKGPELKSLFARLYQEHIAPLPPAQRLRLAYRLFDSRFSEEKSCGTDILRRNLKILGMKQFPVFSRIIDRHIYDWGTCDGLSGKVISRMIRRDSSLAALVYPWKNARGIWRKRAACVCFVNVARFGKHDRMIIDICAACIRSPERFVQLGAGWALRELSLSDRPLVVRFIKRHYGRFSREGLRYAIEKMPPRLRSELLGFRKSREAGA